MKKNTIMRIAAVVLMCTLVTACFASSTFAKYTSEATNTDAATVALWKVSVNDDDISAAAQDIEFDLFAETGVFDLADVADENDLSGEVGVVDADVDTGALVAPGTWGKVQFELKNESEVNAKYKVYIKSLATTLPLQFSADGKDWVDADDIGAPYVLKADDIDMKTGTDTAYLYWKWTFSPDDEAYSDDTLLGAAGTADCQIEAGVLFEQAD